MKVRVEKREGKKDVNVYTAMQKNMGLREGIEVNVEDEIKHFWDKGNFLLTENIKISYRTPIWTIKAILH